MGLDGGGGGGFAGVTNPFTGAAQALEYMGVGYWAGWSGEQTLTVNTEITMFEFLSPLKNLKAQFGFAMNLINQTATDQQMKIFYDDIVVFNLYESAAIDRYGNFGVFPNPHMIIPSGTTVKVIMRNDENVVVTGTSWITAQELSQPTWQ